MSHQSHTQFARRHRLRLTVVIACLGLVAASCADTGATSTTGTQPPGTTSPGDTTTTTEQDVRRGGVLKVAFPLIGLTTLDPYLGSSGVDHVMLRPLFDTLFAFDLETGALMPGLVEELEARDETTLILHLREGVAFHDGEPFDADAVVFNLDRGRSHEASVVRGELASIESVEAIDQYTVQLNLSRPDAALPLMLTDRAGMMGSPAAISADEVAFGQAPVGTGPFRFVEMTTSEGLTVERNDDYWQPELPYLDGIVFTQFADSETAVNAVVSGEQDFTFRVNPRNRERLESADGVQVSLTPTIEHFLMVMHLGRPPFDDVRVRQAVNMAIDRETMLNAMQFGLGEVATQPLPSSHWAHQPQLTIPYDPDGARQLLADAGYADGLTIKVIGFPDPDEVRRAEILQANLADVGITVELTQFPVTEAANQFFQVQGYEGFMGAWTGRPDPNYTYTLLFSSSAFFNVAKHETPGLDDLLVEAVADPDIEYRAEVYSRLTKLIQDEALYVPLYFSVDFSAFRDHVEGYRPNISGKPIFTEVYLGE